MTYVMMMAMRTSMMMTLTTIMISMAMTTNSLGTCYVFQALVQLRQTGRWHQAANTWQTVALQPHFLYQCRGDIWNQRWPFDKRSQWFVVAASFYAVRVWRAHPVKIDGQPSSSVFALDPEEDWHWAVVTDISLWKQLPFKWITLPAEHDKYGFLKMELNDEPVPALVHSLLLIGRLIGQFLKVGLWLLDSKGGRH